VGSADGLVMGRSVIWLCVLVGSTIGGLVPALWGGSAFGLSSLALSALGGAAGVFAGARLSS
jgi:hypothetical protein